MLVNGVWNPTRVGMLMLKMNSCSACLTSGYVRRVVAHEGREQGVEVGDGLSAGRLALEGVEEIDDLPERAAQVPGRRALHLALDPLEPLAQEVQQVPAHAVDGKQVQVVDVEVPLGVGVADLGRVDAVQPVLGGDLGGDVVVQPLQRIAHVAVFADLPVELLDVVVDQVDIGAGRDLADLRVLLAVEDVGLGGLVEGRVEQHPLDDVLDLLHLGRRPEPQLVGQGQHPQGELVRLPVAELTGGVPGLGDGRGDLRRVEFDNPSVALLDFLEHGCNSCRGRGSGDDALARCVHP